MAKQYDYNEAVTICWKYYKDSRCCSVIALAVACQVGIGKAYHAMRRAGRVRGHGAYTYQSERAARELGFLVRDVTREFPRVKTVKTAARYLDPAKNYMVVVKGHILGVRQGEVVDWSKGRGHRVRTILEVTA